ncbi:MAG: YbjQ family protein [Lachnospiraceae bacterium]|nr:YbjQ family protein [Lachnospiraceae bacterium]
MILATTNYITGKNLEILGVVKGNMILSRHLGTDIGQGFKQMVGGELKKFTEMMNQSREDATNRMIKEAERMGADAIISMRYASSSVTQDAAEVIAYGTAVKFI